MRQRRRLLNKPAPGPSKSKLLSAFARRGAAVESPICGVATAAAVAVVFCSLGTELSLCIGRRAQVTGDPWSGDFAFPGGKPEVADGCMHDVAAREACEEAGLILPPSTLLGDLGVMQAGRGHGRAPLPVCPLVYLIDTPPPFTLNHELVAAYWVPVRRIWCKRNWMAFEHSAEGRRFSAIRLEDHFIWGFTLRVIAALGRKLETPLTGLLKPDALPTMAVDEFARQTQQSTV